jgi:hypothetical protein
MGKAKESIAEAVTRYREQVSEKLSLRRGASLGRDAVLAEVKRQGVDGLTSNRLNYLVKNGLIEPEKQERGSRVIFRYGRDQIRDVIVVLLLRAEFRGTSGKAPPYARIATAMSEGSAHGSTSGHDRSQPALEIPVAQTQVERGYYYFRSRMLGVCLNWLCHGCVPQTGFVLVRKLQGAGRTLESDGAIAMCRTLDMQGIDDIVRELKDSDLFGELTVEGEVLFGGRRPTDLRSSQRWTWYYITVGASHHRPKYELALGVPPNSAGTAPSMSDIDAALLSSVLDCCFVSLADCDTAPEEQVTRASRDHNTQLSTITELIPALSESWHYCAVLTPSKEGDGHLRLAAFSSGFPRPLRRDLNVEPGRLLCGWVYKYGCFAVVQRALGPEDPRVMLQDEELSTAALAVPTVAQGRPNGVVYVGTRTPPAEGVSLFGEPAIRLLHIIGYVIGELIERNRIRAKTEQDSRAALALTWAAPRPWAELKGEFSSALEALVSSDRIPGPLDNLLIVVVSVDNYGVFACRNPAVAEWLVEQAMHVVRSMCAQTGLEAPILFQRPPEDPSRFASVIYNVVRTDEQDREWRTNLRGVLNSISIPFEARQPTLARCYVWSMPFRLAGLKARVKGADTDNIATWLVKRAEEALQYLPHIERGHAYELARKWEQALQEYLAALALSPRSEYLLRHVAKTQTAAGYYTQAIVALTGLLKGEDVSSHHRRLARAYACLGMLEMAEKSYLEASKSHTEGEHLLEWGDVLMARGKCDEAIEKYGMVPQNDESDKVTYLLRIAEANMKLGRLNEASQYVQLALSNDPSRWESIRLLMRVQQTKELAKTEGETDGGCASSAQ